MYTKSQIMALIYNGNPDKTYTGLTFNDMVTYLIYTQLAENLQGIINEIAMDCRNMAADVNLEVFQISNQADPTQNLTGSQLATAVGTWMGLNPDLIILDKQMITDSVGDTFYFIYYK